jgi:hypothetical protein
MIASHYNAVSMLRDLMTYLMIAWLSASGKSPSRMAGTRD